MEKTKKIQIYSSLIIFLSLAVLALVLVNKHAEEQRILACNDSRESLKNNSFGVPLQNIGAKAFFMYDFSQNAALYGRNESEPLPLASLTKLMTVRLALKKVSPFDFYTVRPHDLDSDGFVGFVPGDSYRISDLVRGALIASINDSAVMLARSTGASDLDFVGTMNQEALNLGLSSLRFGNPTGLDINDTVATAYGSPHDILMLLFKDYTDFTDLISQSTRESDSLRATNGRLVSIKNTNLAIDKLPLLLASKTGYTDTAGGNLVILWRETGGDILGASLLGSTEDGRFSDMITLHDAANRYILGLRALPEFCSKNI